MLNESRIPATVLINILDALGADLQYIRTGNHLLRHSDLYDSIWSVLGDLLAELSLRDLGRNTVDGRVELERFQRKQKMAYELAVRLSEAYDRNVKDHVVPLPLRTINDLRNLKSKPASPDAEPAD